jgi:lipopolysaccharide export system protein LptA
MDALKAYYMKIRHYSNLRVSRLAGIGLAIVALVAGLAAAVPGFAADAENPGKGDPIHITSDKLVTDNAKRSAKFSGHVKAVQGDTVITCDQLTIFFKAGSNTASKISNNDIERLLAEGHVRIEFDNKVAVSNQAVYIIAERKLILSGPGSKVISGQDEISGSKITFFRDDGRVMLESDGRNRVNAIIHSDHQGLN